MQTYQIEYMVLKEEMSEQGTESEPQSSQGKQLEGENKELQKQNAELSDQLQVKCLIVFLIFDKISLTVDSCVSFVLHFLKNILLMYLINF